MCTDQTAWFQTCLFEQATGKCKNRFRVGNDERNGFLDATECADQLLLHRQEADERAQKHDAELLDKLRNEVEASVASKTQDALDEFENHKPTEDCDDIAVSILCKGHVKIAFDVPAKCYKGGQDTLLEFDVTGLGIPKVGDANYLYPRVKTTPSDYTKTKLFDVSSAAARGVVAVLAQVDPIYDAVTNNCAIFVKKVVEGIGKKLDKGAIDTIVESLSHSGNFYDRFAMAKGNEDMQPDQIRLEIAKTLA